MDDRWPILELIPQHLLEHYSDALRIHISSALSPSPSDRTGRRFVVTALDEESQPETRVVEVRPVGGKNAGAFRGWVTIAGGDMRRIGAGRPSGFRTYTLMVGATPDDRSIYWSALYDDEKLAGLPWESQEDGRWYRLSPQDALPALIQPIVDVHQQVLPIETPSAAPEEPPKQAVVPHIIWTDDPGRQPNEREKAEWLINEAVAVFRDPSRMSLLPGPFLFEFLEFGLPDVVKAAGKYNRVRVEQSYSAHKAGKK